MRRSFASSRLRKVLLSDMKQYRILRFLIKFNLFAIPLYIILLANWQWAWLQTFTADIVQAMLHSIGIAAERAGNFIVIQLQSGQWGAFINWDCTGWKSFLALFALVMATDFSAKKKMKGLMLLLPALFIVNIARIVFMFYFVHSFDLAYFEIAHAVIWSWGLIFAVLALWGAWARSNRFFPNAHI